jgi:hypothetical protein
MLALGAGISGMAIFAAASMIAALRETKSPFGGQPEEWSRYCWRDSAKLRVQDQETVLNSRLCIKISSCTLGETGSD